MDDILVNEDNVILRLELDIINSVLVVSECILYTDNWSKSRVLDFLRIPKHEYVQLIYCSVV